MLASLGRGTVVVASPSPRRMESEIQCSKITINPYNAERLGDQRVNEFCVHGLEQQESFRPFSKHRGGRDGCSAVSGATKKGQFQFGPLG